MLADRSGTSLLFSDVFAELLRESEVRAEVRRLLDITSVLRRFALNSLFVTGRMQVGTVHAGVFLAMPVAECSEADSPSLIVSDTLGAAYVAADGVAALSEATFRLLKSTLDQINRLLEVMIPGMRLQTGSEVRSTSDKGTAELRFEMQSERDGIRIPLQYESNGIRHLISLLSLLIMMYNKKEACVVIVELDAGVSEYLLGEIVCVLQDGGLGQLVFTSHNLRSLEVLRDRNLVFTTTDPNNRYTRLKGLKPSDNKRDVYRRNIVYGSEGTEYYDAMDRTDLDYAFQEAGDAL